jgi:restriction system protein
MLPVLRHAASGEISVKECIGKIALDFGLSDEDLEEMLPSGRQTKFANRVHWAKTYLVQAGLLEMTRRAHFRASERGRAVLQQNPDKIDNAFLQQFEEFRDFKTRKGSTSTEVSADAKETSDKNVATPEEQIEAAFEEINAELRSELLERITSASPQFFEQLVVDLMIAMGYGSSLQNAGKRLGRSGDGGVDGVINEDTLGLDSIYLQAKRFAPHVPVGVEKVREFNGSLDERGASKGVLLTTSYFPAGAREYVDRVQRKMILIDGEELTRLLIRYGVGVRTARTVELKKLDLDYFEQDDGA